MPGERRKTPISKERTDPRITGNYNFGTLEDYLAARLSRLEAAHMLMQERLFLLESTRCGYSNRHCSRGHSPVTSNQNVRPFVSSSLNHTSRSSISSTNRSRVFVSYPEDHTYESTCSPVTGTVTRTESYASEMVDFPSKCETSNCAAVNHKLKPEKRNTLNTNCTLQFEPKVSSSPSPVDPVSSKIPSDDAADSVANHTLKPPISEGSSMQSISNNIKIDRIKFEKNTQQEEFIEIPENNTLQTKNLNLSKTSEQKTINQSHEFEEKESYSENYSAESEMRTPGEIRTSRVSFHEDQLILLSSEDQQDWLEKNREKIHSLDLHPHKLMQLKKYSLELEKNTPPRLEKSNRESTKINSLPQLQGEISQENISKKENDRKKHKEKSKANKLRGRKISKNKTKHDPSQDAEPCDGLNSVRLRKKMNTQRDKVKYSSKRIKVKDKNSDLSSDMCTCFEDKVTNTTYPSVRNERNIGSEEKRYGFQIETQDKINYPTCLVKRSQTFMVSGFQEPLVDDRTISNTETSMIDERNREEYFSNPSKIQKDFHQYKNDMPWTQEIGVFGTEGNVLCSCKKTTSDIVIPAIGVLQNSEFLSSDVINSQIQPQQGDLLQGPLCSDTLTQSKVLNNRNNSQDLSKSENIGKLDCKECDESSQFTLVTSTLSSMIARDLVIFENEPLRQSIKKHELVDTVTLCKSLGKNLEFDLYENKESSSLNTSSSFHITHPIHLSETKSEIYSEEENEQNSYSSIPINNDLDHFQIDFGIVSSKEPLISGILPLAENTPPRNSKISIDIVNETEMSPMYEKIFDSKNRIRDDDAVVHNVKSQERNNLLITDNSVSSKEMDSVIYCKSTDQNLSFYQNECEELPSFNPAVDSSLNISNPFTEITTKSINCVQSLDDRISCVHVNMDTENSSKIKIMVIENSTLEKEPDLSTRVPNSSASQISEFSHGNTEQHILSNYSSWDSIENKIPTQITELTDISKSKEILYSTFQNHVSFISQIIKEAINICIPQVKKAEERKDDRVPKEFVDDKVQNNVIKDHLERPVLYISGIESIGLKTSCKSLVKNSSFKPSHNYETFSPEVIRDERGTNTKDSEEEEENTSVLLRIISDISAHKSVNYDDQEMDYILNNIEQKEIINSYVKSLEAKRNSFQVKNTRVEKTEEFVLNQKRDVPNKSKEEIEINSVIGSAQISDTNMPEEPTNIEMSQTRDVKQEDGMLSSKPKVIKIKSHEGNDQPENFAIFITRKRRKSNKKKKDLKIDLLSEAFQVSDNYSHDEISKLQCSHFQDNGQKVNIVHSFESDVSIFRGYNDLTNESNKLNNRQCNKKQIEEAIETQITQYENAFQEFNPEHIEITNYIDSISSEDDSDNSLIHSFKKVYDNKSFREEERLIPDVIHMLNETFHESSQKIESHEGESNAKGKYSDISKHSLMLATTSEVIKNNSSSSFGENIWDTDVDSWTQTPYDHFSENENYPMCWNELIFERTGIKGNNVQNNFVSESVQVDIELPQERIDKETQVELKKGKLVSTFTEKSGHSLKSSRKRQSPASEDRQTSVFNIRKKVVGTVNDASDPFLRLNFNSPEKKLSCGLVAKQTLCADDGCGSSVPFMFGSLVKNLTDGFEVAKQSLCADIACGPSTPIIFSTHVKNFSGKFKLAKTTRHSDIGCGPSTPLIPLNSIQKDSGANYSYLKTKNASTNTHRRRAVQKRKSESCSCATCGYSVEPASTGRISCDQLSNEDCDCKDEGVVTPLPRLDVYNSNWLIPSTGQYTLHNIREHTSPSPPSEDNPEDSNKFPDSTETTRSLNSCNSECGKSSSEYPTQVSGKRKARGKKRKQSTSATSNTSALKYDNTFVLGPPPLPPLMPTCASRPKRRSTYEKRHRSSNSQISPIRCQTDSANLPVHRICVSDPTSFDPTKIHDSREPSDSVTLSVEQCPYAKCTCNRSRSISRDNRGEICNIIGVVNPCENADSNHSDLVDRRHKTKVLNSKRKRSRSNSSHRKNGG